ncbi:MAG: flavoprotein [Tenericutes bacterium GWF2_57_13]|nr:MAG: flavoprotein [Tenericutes bacterium GWF2_57_13]
MKRPEIIVIGGGASGILAAIVARHSGANVTILEKNPRIGKKILATGNGRCNYTNVLATAADYNHPDFVAPVLERFGPDRTIAFFEGLGIAPKVEEEGKAFPRSEQASSFLDVFLYELNASGVNVVCDAPVVRLVQAGRGFQVILADGTRHDADKVILSTGGKAMPSSGSDGSGYALAERLGHQLTPIYPALAKLTLDSPYLKQLDGVKIPGKAELLHQGIVLQSEKDDILFTKYGISGPTILRLSRKANELTLQGKTVQVRVVLLDTVNRADVEKRFAAALDRPVDFSLIGLVHKKLIPALIKEAGILKQDILVSKLTATERKKLIDLLFDWRFIVTGNRGFEDAQVTVGGIAVSDIDPVTMESKLVPGLYFTGEIVDIDGPCGGFNLQWAWASGFAAGTAASDTGAD